MRAGRVILSVVLSVFSLTLYAETATYMVSSYHDIALTDGVAPEGSAATFYSTTGSGSRITAGNTATLTITGYEGYHISSIVLLMRSNKSSGGGSLHLWLDETEKGTIADAPFADATWNGAYAGGSEWAQITVPMESGFDIPLNGVVTIVVEASVNSLYLGGCVVTYRAGSSQLLPRLVVFSTGTEERITPVREVTAGSGITLPAWHDADSVWHFLGWTEASLPHTETCPSYFRARTIYYPTVNTTLYALYCNKSGDAELVQDTTLVSGQYALVSGGLYNCMMCGSVDSDHRIGTKNVQPYMGRDSLYRIGMETVPDSCRYNLTVSGETVTIQHVATSKYIGYNSSHELQNKQSEWSVFRAAYHSVMFYHDLQADERLYGIHPTMVAAEPYYKDIRLYPQSTQQLMLLFPVPAVEPEPARYTTNPRSGVGIPQVEKVGIIVSEGRVLNPSRARLILYTLSGVTVRSTDEELSLSDLPSGMYVLRAGDSGQIIHVK